jgi:nucleoside-diphosphate-sugar epimerase
MDLVSCDLASEAVLTEVLAGADTVVNCVAGDAEAMLRSARALFAVAGTLGGRVVQLSTMAAYGSATGPISEDSPLLGDVDAYAAARAQVDRMAAQYGAVILRPGIIYGPGSVRWSGQMGRLLCTHRLGDLGVLGDGDCNLLFIDDLLNALLKVVQQPDCLQGAVNLCGVERLTWNDYFIRYARALRAVPVRRITARRLKLETKLFAPPLKIASLLVGSARRHLPELISPSMLRVFTQDIQLQTRKASETLQLSWTDLDSGLQQSASWFNEEYGSQRGSQVASR